MILGGAYLVVLGVRTLLRRRSLAAALPAAPSPRSDRQALVQGFTVGVTNPKTVVFLAAILPQFTSRAEGHVPAQILLLGAMFAAIAVVSDTAWATVAGAARSWFERSPRRLEMIGGIGGLAMAAIGVALLVSGRKQR